MFAFLLMPVLALKPRKFAVLYAHGGGTRLTLDGQWALCSSLPGVA